MDATNNTMLPQLDEDTIDDLLYCARTGDLATLQADVATLSSKHDAPPLSIVSVAVDEYSGNTLVHYASANGHSDIITYILSLPPAPTLSPATLLTKPNTAVSTPLHYAALNGHLSICKLLLEAIPKGSPLLNDFITAKNSAGRDAAFEAESAEKEEVVTYLLGIMDDVEMATGGDGDVSISAGEGSGDAEGEVEAVANGVQEMDVDGDSK